MRQNEDKALAFKTLDSNVFLKLVDSDGDSDEFGSIKSCFEDQLKNKKDGYGAFGLFGCNQLLGGVSYNISEIKHDRGLYGLVLDAVVVKKNLRGKGLGELLILNLFSEMLRQYNCCVKHFRTTAIHKGVAHCVMKLGFDAPSMFAKSPEYVKILDKEKIKSFFDEIETSIQSKSSQLQRKCHYCLLNTIYKAWCK